MKFGKGLRPVAILFTLVGFSSTGIVLSAEVQKGTSSFAPATVACQSITGAPLQISVAADQSFQVVNSSFPGAGQFFPSNSGLCTANVANGADFGVIVKMQSAAVCNEAGGARFGPNFAAHGSTATPGGFVTPWTFVSQTPPTVSGSTTTVKTVSTAGATGLELTTTVRYVNGQNFFTHDFSFKNNSSSSLRFNAYLGGDLYLAGTDTGAPTWFPPAVGGLGPLCATTYRVLLHPFDVPANRTGNTFSNVWSQIQNNANLDNAVATACAPNPIDDGAALQWKCVTLAPGATRTIRAATSFGPIPNEFGQIGANKDFINNTGQTVNDFEWLVEGNYTSVLLNINGPFPAFQIVPVGANTLFRWSGANVANGATIHTGIKVPGTILKTLGTTWTLNGNFAGCVRQISLGTNGSHQLGQGTLSFENTVNAPPNCPAIPVYVKNIRVEYHASEVPLANLNASTVRTPIRADAIGDLGLLAVGEEQSIQIKETPLGTRYAVVQVSVADNPAMTNQSTDWFQVEVPAEAVANIPTLPEWGMTALILLLLGSAIYVLRRRGTGLTNPHA